MRLKMKDGAMPSCHWRCPGTSALSKVDGKARAFIKDPTEPSITLLKQKFSVQSLVLVNSCPQDFKWFSLELKNSKMFQNGIKTRCEVSVEECLLSIHMPLHLLPSIA